MKASRSASTRSSSSAPLRAVANSFTSAGQGLFAPHDSVANTQFALVFALARQMMGDVPASMLAAGTPDDVHAYVEDLIQTFGGTGLLVCPGCDAPINARPENMQAIVDTVHSHDKVVS